MNALVQRIFNSLLATIIGGSFLVLLMGISIYQRKSNNEKANTIYEFRERVARGSVQEYWLLNKTIEIDPNFDKAHMAKSYTLLRRGLYTEAFDAMDKAIAVRPKDRLAYRANTKLYRMHDYEGALEDLRKLDALTPNFRDAVWGEDLYHVMGLAYKQAGRLKTALFYFDLSIKETTEEEGENFVHVKTFYYRAMTKLALGQTKSALDDLNRALYYFDKYTEAYYQKAYILKEFGEHEAAYEAMKAADKYYKEGYLYGSFDRIYFSDIERGLSEFCVDEDLLKNLKDEALTS